MIRTIDDLDSRISEDINWRRKELTELKAMVQTFKGDPIRSRVLIRSAIALLYAHWEGFVKKSSSDYLEFVASLRLPYKNLAFNFVGLSLRTKFSELGNSKKISRGNALAKFFCTQLDSRSNLPFRDGVDTKSNLSSTVLLDIIEALGLDVSQFETRMKFIDSNLVGPRNHVAHGSSIELSVDEYLQLHEGVLGLIETYRNEIQNASSQRRFERVIA